MKNILLAFLLMPLFFKAHGQEPGNYKTVVSAFSKLYNNALYDSVWQLFSPQMQEALPPDKTQKFFTQFKELYGDINSNTFDKKDGSVIIYKTACTNGIISLRISLDGKNKISGLRFVPHQQANAPSMERNKTVLQLPFTGEWTIFWGGDTREQNYHVDNMAQKNAFDILITDNAGRSYKTNGKTNADYYDWAQPITAPCEGQVVMAVDGVKDNIPGEMNPICLTGNSVTIKTANNEYLLFAHLKNHSVAVKEGDMIKVGQAIGLCGNSGNSSEPHLHFHIQNIENMNGATGVKCYFDKISVNGAVKKDYSPVKGDKVKNVD